MAGIDGKVTSLLHFDESYNMDDVDANSWATNYGAPVFNVDVKKFGNSSLYLNGTSGLQTQSYNLDFTSGKEWTLEFWINATTTAGNPFNNYTGSGSTDLSLALDCSGNSSLAIYLSSNGTSWDVVSSAIVGTYTANVFNHIALTLKNDLLTVFINGVSKYTKSLAGISVHKSTTGMSIGCAVAAYSLKGYVDEFRV